MLTCHGQRYPLAGLSCFVIGNLIPIQKGRIQKSLIRKGVVQKSPIPKGMIQKSSLQLGSELTECPMKYRAEAWKKLNLRELDSIRVNSIQSASIRPDPRPILSESMRVAFHFLNTL